MGYVGSPEIVSSRGILIAHVWSSLSSSGFSSWLVSCVLPWHLQQELSDEHSLSFPLKESQQVSSGATNFAASLPIPFLSFHIERFGFGRVTAYVSMYLFVGTW